MWKVWLAHKGLERCHSFCSVFHLRYIRIKGYTAIAMIWLGKPSSSLGNTPLPSPHTSSYLLAYLQSLHNEPITKTQNSNTRLQATMERRWFLFDWTVRLLFLDSVLSLQDCRDLPLQLRVHRGAQHMPYSREQSQPPATLFMATLLTSPISLDRIKTKMYFEFHGHLLYNDFVYHNINW